MTTATNTSVPGYIGRIPVRNIWLLFLYASQLYRELPAPQRVALEDAPDDIPDLVAKILAKAVERRLRRNLSHDYQRRHDDLNRVRGRIDLFRTERRQLLQRARVACIFDELAVDTPRNRYVKAALLRLASVVRSSDVASRCRNLATRMERAGVQTELDPKRRRRDATPDNLGWTESEERQMLAAARLAFDLVLPTEDAGTSYLPAPCKEEHWARKLFEAAVGGFYDVVLLSCGWDVETGNTIHWHLEGPTPSLLGLMPEMKTDIRLEHGNQRIIIDTKFTEITTIGRFGKETFKSGNIYQLYAYLRSQERDHDPLSINSTGILLYPSLGVDYDESGTVQGHRIRFATVNLAAETQTIRKQLLRIVEDCPTSAS